MAIPTQMISPNLEEQVRVFIHFQEKTILWMLLETLMHKLWIKDYKKQFSDIPMLSNRPKGQHYINVYQQVLKPPRNTVPQSKHDGHNLSTPCFLLGNRHKHGLTHE